jgi:DUF971 family protein
MDNGWNSELAVANIEKFLRKLEIDLETVVLDWDEFRDLQLAFLRSSTTDGEVPTDHAILAVLFRAAAQRNIDYILRGSNIATEGLHSDRWTYGFYDWRYIRSIHRLFGERRRLKHYPHFSYFNGSYLYYRAVKRIRMVNLLNYVAYDKRDAMRVLREDLGWTPYGGKHYESIYTRFFQGYILPRKFNLDKRRGHLSTLIMSGQMTREQALEEVSHDPYSGYGVGEDREYVLKKLGLTPEAFEELMRLPPKTYRDYPNEERWHEVMRGSVVMRAARRLGLLPVERVVAAPTEASGPGAADTAAPAAAETAAARTDHA